MAIRLLTEEAGLKQAQAAAKLMGDGTEIKLVKMTPDKRTAPAAAAAV